MGGSSGRGDVAGAAGAGSRVLSRNSAVGLAGDLRQSGRRLVVTNGCFDILHVGHIRYLEAARAFGDVLMVGVNTDASVRRLKGPERPLVPEGDRAEVLASLRCVDWVTLFEEDTAESLVLEVRPHVYVKGGDYSPENCPEALVVMGYGGEARFVELVPGQSTTAIAGRMLYAR